MDDKKQKTGKSAGKKKLWIQICVPVFIVAVICGIWFMKSASEKTETLAPDVLEDGNFALNETEMIDYEALSEHGLPIIVDYGSDSCAPCKAMLPALETLNEEMSGKAFIKFVDVWKYTDAAGNVPVQVIPTQVIFNADGTPFVPSDELAAQIPFDMYSHKETGEHVFTVHQGGLTEEQLRAILKEMGVE